MRLASTHPGDVADGAVLCRSHGLERLGRVDQVLEVPAEDAGLLDRVEHALGLSRVATQRLGHQHGLAGLGHGGDRLLVKEVGQRHDDRVGIGVVRWLPCMSVVDSGIPWRSLKAWPRSSERE